MAIDVQPTLRGQLLTLRPLRADDFDSLYAPASDPLIWEQHPDADRYERPVFERFFEDALASGSALTAVDNDDGSVIGSSRYNRHDVIRREIEIGWSFLVRRCWGGRYNGEMKRLMLDHAFTFVDSVVLIVGAHNVRSRRAVEKIGGVLSGTITDVRGRESVVYRVRPSGRV
jgi:RimJ/RimL family protein N-acetyltransferase